MIKMDDKNGMVGWEKPGFGDKVITTDVGGRKSEEGRRMTEVEKQKTGFRN
jgi:hypothetical protein